jgi:N-acetylneuraminic acid mutarotase
MMGRAATMLLLLAACGSSDGSAPDAGEDARDSDGGARTWAPAAAIPGGVIQETAAVALDGTIWVMGGLTSFTAYSNKVWVLDTAAGTWAAGPDLPMAVHHANAAVVGNSIYVVGALATNFSAIGTVWRHTPGVDTGWVARTSMPAGTQRGASIVGVIGGVIYLAGGYRGGAAVTDVSSYDPAGDSWDDAVADLAASRDHGCGGVIGDKLYVAGGRMASIGSTTNTVFELTPGAGWTARAPMPTGRGGTACGVIDGRLIVVGGEGNPNAASGVFPHNEAYTAATDSWETLEPMRTPRHGMQAAAWGGVLYVPAGATQQALGATDVVETFTP